ncbi:MAG: hypothetical protein WAM14_19820 [Candidatus Nitrosopolaris sp.]
MRWTSITLKIPRNFLMYYELKKYKYDDKRIMAEFSIRRSMKKERLGIEFDRADWKIGY